MASKRARKTTLNVSIDPGRDFGWALWDDAHWRELVPPTETGVIISKGSDWLRSCEKGFNRFKRELVLRRLRWNVQYRVAIIEWPVFYDDAGGHMVAKRGDLNKLVFSVGWFACMCSELGMEVNLLPVPQWKGQLPKSVVNYRIVKLLGKDACSTFATHAWDAVGLGLYWKGFLNR